MILWHLFTLIIFFWLWVDIGSFWSALLGTIIVWLIGCVVFGFIGSFINIMTGKDTDTINLPWRRRKGN